MMEGYGHTVAQTGIYYGFFYRGCELIHLFDLQSELFGGFKGLPCALHDGFIYHLAAEGYRALALLLAEADGFKDILCVPNILERGAEYLVYRPDMTGRDGGLSGETEALCVLGICDYALIIVYIGEGGIVYINPGSPRRDREGLQLGERRLDEDRDQHGCRETDGGDCAGDR